MPIPNRAASFKTEADGCPPRAKLMNFRQDRGPADEQVSFDDRPGHADSIVIANEPGAVSAVVEDVQPHFMKFAELCSHVGSAGLARSKRSRAICSFTASNAFWSSSRTAIIGFVVQFETAEQFKDVLRFWSKRAVDVHKSAVLGDLCVHLGWPWPATTFVLERAKSECAATLQGAGREQLLVDCLDGLQNRPVDRSVGGGRIEPKLSVFSVYDEAEAILVPKNSAIRGDVAMGNDDVGRAFWVELHHVGDPQQGRKIAKINTLRWRPAKPHLETRFFAALQDHRGDCGKVL